MAAGLTVGDFSRATHLSASKMLRHYHQVGLLEPAAVNPDTGSRSSPCAADADTPDGAEWRTEIGWPIFRADASRA